MLLLLNRLTLNAGGKIGLYEFVHRSTVCTDSKQRQHLYNIIEERYNNIAIGKYRRM